jgi:hypothetical protein
MAKGLRAPAMCASSVEPFSVERGSFVSKAMARHDDELLCARLAVCPEIFWVDGAGRGRFGR